MPNPAPGEIIASEAGQKGQSRRFGGMTQFPRLRGVRMRFLCVAQAQTCSSGAQFHQSCTTDCKKRGKISATAKTGRGLVGFGARWAGNIHKRSLFSKSTWKNVRRE
jgi:hypothetical protein